MNLLLHLEGSHVEQPLEMPLADMSEMSRLTFVDRHFGHEMLSSSEPTNSSKASPQSVHLYSKSGIITLHHHSDIDRTAPVADPTAVAR